MKRRDLLKAAPAALLAPRLARAQAYPSRPIRYIVPVAPGGGNDMIARVVTERWGKLLGQTFVVDNLGGGGGVVACSTTAHSAPDGYTLMQSYVATHGTTPATRKVNYDALKDFTPIGMIGATPNILAVNANVPAKTVAEFIDYVKKSPKPLSYGSAGAGSLTHMTMELFKQQSGVDMVHVPYRGIAPAINDLLGGQTQAMFPGLRRRCRTSAPDACVRLPLPARSAAASCRRCRRWKKPASRVSTRCSGTVRPVRPACRRRSSSASRIP